MERPSVTSLPSINAIRGDLSRISAALVEDPRTTRGDVGDAPYVPIHDPESGELASAPSEQTDEGNGDEEPTIIFEIPPELDDRAVAEALSESGGRDFEALIRLTGVDAL